MNCNTQLIKFISPLTLKTNLLSLYYPNTKWGSIEAKPSSLFLDSRKASSPFSCSSPWTKHKNSPLNGLLTANLLCSRFPPFTMKQATPITVFINYYSLMLTQTSSRGFIVQRDPSTTSAGAPIVKFSQSLVALCHLPKSYIKKMPLRITSLGSPTEILSDFPLFRDLL